MCVGSLPTSAHVLEPGGSNLTPPVSPGARLLRVVLVLAVDAVMVVVGIFLLRSGLEARSQASAVSRAGMATEVLTPRPVPRPAAPETVARAPDRSPVPTTAKKKAPAKAANRAVPAQTKRKPAAKPPKPEAKPSKPEARPEPENRPSPAPDPVADKPEEAPSNGSEPDSNVESPSGAGAGAGEAGPDGAAGDTPEETPEVRPGQAPDEEVARLAGQIGRVVDRNRASLGRCYQRAAKGQGADWALEGQVEIRLTVLPNGGAANVRPASNDTGSDVLADCLVNLVRSWQFPAHGYDPIDFVWPFVFHPPN